MNDLQVISQIDQSINDAHGRAEAVAGGLRDKVVEYANAVRECGLLLNVRRDQIHGDARWCEMFSTHHGKCSEAATFNFDYSWGCKYMKLAKQHPEPFASIEEVREYHKLIGVSAGMLEEGTRANGQTSHDFNLAAELVNIVTRMSATWNKHNGREFFASLPAHAKEQMADTLRPAKEKIDMMWEAVTA